MIEDSSNLTTSPMDDKFNDKESIEDFLRIPSNQYNPSLEFLTLEEIKMLESILRHGIKIWIR
ncbi:hypothetical protein ACOMICROBIO_LMKGKHOH_05292 [Vibrio sp. B1FIG11]|uniref:hypothetical protein n=1 Tax=Vibrio sp. B1FIG11 TaxID=2751177 RepID=UPI001AF58549|nr:hypothetical protein [Vibrio sp. B1FIG11]CAD7824636.1 hypothetical protein ACOMICROBIO_LMKGKHOH_05292 [Vibrio sp. B1FIG11]CAE6953143.1 hypothetical protein ACOMICROBIO_LMKGKHOH_05292 [Vibrio sp. B1FIG11]